MPPYNEQFPVGTRVQIAPQERLDEFKRSWRYHHPLTLEQLSFAGRPAVVRNVGFYHGGDVLYELEGIPGLWHEQCLLSPPRRTNVHAAARRRASICLSQSTTRFQLVKFRLTITVQHHQQFAVDGCDHGRQESNRPSIQSVPR
jgi:hypothetical protein